MKTCNNCGKELSDDFLICPYCGETCQGTNQQESEKDFTEPNEPKEVSAEQPQDIPETTESQDSTPENIAVSKPDEGEKHVVDSPKQQNRKSGKTIAFISIAVVLFLAIVAGILVFILSPKVVSIEAVYNGDTEEGIVLDSRNNGFTVTGEKENGKTVELKTWSIESPKTLTHDKTEKVEIAYKKLTCTVSVKCSTSAVESIHLSYDGSREDGFEIDSVNVTGFEVIAYLLNGDEVDITKQCNIDNLPIQFKADETEKISVSYTDPVSGKTFNDKKNVMCSTQTIVSISASYSGSKAAGVVLDEDNDGIKVKAKYKNGKEEVVEDWTAETTAKLKADETSKITIEYEGKKCTLSVTCSTMSESAYKAKCKTISYTNLARNPSQYEGQYVKYNGKVVQVMESSFYKAYRVNVTKNRYYYDDTVYVTYITFEDGNRVLEDDIITFYGEYDGLYSYETVMGATVTIPKVNAKYIEIH